MAENEITIADIKRSFNSVYFNRAFEYLDRIEKYSVEQKNGVYTINADIYGSTFNTYRVDIKFTSSIGSKISGNCTCPVGYNCKHVAAVMIKLLKEGIFDKDIQRQNRLMFLNKWIDTLKEELGEEDGRELSHPTQLFYVLDIDQKGKLVIDLLTRKKLKKGGYGKEYSFNFDKFRYYPPEYATTNDEKILKILSGILPYHYYSSTITIRDDILNLLIERLIKSKKCYFRNDREKILCYGETISASLQWVEIESGVFNLGVDLKNRAREILLYYPYRYIDTEKNEIGKVTSLPYDMETLKLLLDAPAVEKEDLDYLTKQLIELSSTVKTKAPLPLPAQKQMQTIEVKPTFKLEIFSGFENETPMIDAKLGVYYNRFLVALDQEKNEELFYENGSVIKIKRDSKSEKEAVDQLLSYRFVEIQEQSSKESRFILDRSNPQFALSSYRRFMNEGIEELKQLGWQIVLNEENESVEFVDLDTIDAHIEEQNGWFDLSFSIEVEGKAFNSAKLIGELLQSIDSPNDLPDTIYLEVEKGKFATLPKNAIEPIVATLFELFDGLDEKGITLHGFDAPMVAKLQNGAISFSGSQRLFEIAKELESFDHIEKIAPPKGLQAKLRPYQEDGLSWLGFLRRYGFGGVLGDDMGLGKTLQSVAHILLEKEQGRLDAPTLVIAPTSLMYNWKEEIEKFAPDLSVVVLQGMQRKKDFEKIEKSDIVLTTYPLIVRDFKELSKHSYYYIILDEAQKIKNHKAKSSQYVKALKSKHRLCLTGTPLENHLGELWSLFDFVMPGFLFNYDFFKEQFKDPIEKEQNQDRQRLLNERIKPFLLRRTKEEVVKELPPKTEVVQKVVFSKEQAKLYESIRIAMDKQVRDAISKKGLARSQIMVLDALLKLRQVCCDPRLLKVEEAKKVHSSAKFEALFELFEELLEEGRRVLLFSQFTSMLSLIENELKKRKISYTKLTGATRKRQEAIERFKNGEADIFLISLKAGGVGLNLTEADTIIHYDPWWNPAVENQATDRAYRIGQDKPVMVYKLIVANTLEEKIIELQERKRVLAQNIYKEKNEAFGLTQQDLQDLFKPIEER